MASVDFFLVGIKSTRLLQVSSGLINNKGPLAVVIFGARTFEVSILELFDSYLISKVKASKDDIFLGGEDFDNALLDYLMSEFIKTDEIDLTKDRLALSRLREAAEKAKIELSSSCETEINLPSITSDASCTKDLNITLTRSKFECLGLLFTSIVHRLAHQDRSSLLLIASFHGNRFTGLFTKIASS
ncbi:hypothetical protein IFM89_004822 [Coptis chinensis]|uniref:Heat shock protein 70 n=1 Tax=Coptis chinensis TaxID=261450 RepID=A0A835LDK9_9MAGN|nr:hypothetical protein IFM89_004822 [Coptis chinensis]